MMSRWLWLVTLSGVAALWTAAPAAAESISLTPSRDNTLFESATGGLSNGSGSYFFAGKTMFAQLRRGLLAFDVAGSVPAGSNITSASLRLHMSMTSAAAENVALHRALHAWGEGASDAPDEEGGGAAAAAGDATWIHTYFPGAFWNNPGGDFDPLASASQVVIGVGHYTWSSTPALVADVQTWLDDPAQNAGWLALGDESINQTAKRFDSREISDPALRPILTIQYTPVPEPASIALLALSLCWRHRRVASQPTGTAD